MTPETWTRLGPHFDHAADLPPEAQQAYVDALAAGDPDLARSLSRLLRFDRGASLAGAVVQAAVADLSEGATPAFGPGTRVGAYDIVREIGRGGMGVVYEAVRADDSFRKRVALKIVPDAAASPLVLDRFRHERQILADLEHPHIARLLDGGATDGGVPFFAMEFVEGTPITRHADTRGLSLAARLALFLDVCDAVEYAHQHLVIHRDLKPANILVTANGQVKLLDFGIAKLVGPGGASGAVTQHVHVPLTPDYASPEQVAGQAVTTRTDVYLLGLLLYELVVGERAQHGDVSSPLALMKSIAETPVARPSTRAAARGDTERSRALRGDLDTIVARATHKDSRLRFPAVSALAADLRLHLSGRPITSRPAAGWYRAAKFLRRHALVSTAAALALVAVAGGTIAVQYQARRAARRFDQVRSLAHALMFDLQDLIKPLPASVAAQHALVGTALTYLDALTADAGGDDALPVELATGYVRIADIQGGFRSASQGRSDEAFASLDKAYALLAPIRARRPDDEAALAAWADANLTKADLLRFTGDTAQARSLVDSTIAALVTRASRPGMGLAADRRLAHARQVRLAFAESQDAADLARALVASLAPMEDDARRDLDVLTEIVVGYSTAGGAVLRTPAELDGVAWLDRGAAYAVQLVERAPERAEARRVVATLHSKRGSLLLRRAELGRLADAVASYATMADAIDWTYQRDPSNPTNRLDRAVSRCLYGDARPTADADGVRDLRTCIGWLDELATDRPDDLQVRMRRWDAQFRLGMRLARRREWNASREALTSAVRLSEALTRDDPSNAGYVVQSYMRLGNLHDALGDQQSRRQVAATLATIAPAAWRARVADWTAHPPAPAAAFTP